MDIEQIKYDLETIYKLLRITESIGEWNDVATYNEEDQIYEIELYQHDMTITNSPRPDEFIVNTDNSTYSADILNTIKHIYKTISNTKLSVTNESIKNQTKTITFSDESYIIASLDTINLHYAEDNEELLSMIRFINAYDKDKNKLSKFEVLTRLSLT